MFEEDANPTVMGVPGTPIDTVDSSAEIQNGSNTTIFDWRSLVTNPAHVQILRVTFTAIGSMRNAVGTRALPCHPVHGKQIRICGRSALERTLFQ
jgi:hypothetical protein